VVAFLRDVMMAAKVTTALQFFSVSKGRCDAAKSLEFREATLHEMALDKGNRVAET
jgi:hypothetical protein